MLKVRGILYPTDFSTCAQHAFSHALHLAETFGADLHLLHALVLHEADPGNAAHRLPSMEHLYEALEEHAESQMVSATAEHGDRGFEIVRAQVRSISAAGATYLRSAGMTNSSRVLTSASRAGRRRE